MFGCTIGCMFVARAFGDSGMAAVVASAAPAVADEKQKQSGNIFIRLCWSQSLTSRTFTVVHRIGCVFKSDAG